MARGRRRYKPAAPFNTAMKLLVPTITMVKGTKKYVYPKPEDVTDVFFGSFRTFGGTESTENNIYSVIDTATIDTWFDPKFKANCRIYLCEEEETYEITGKPEDINKQHQYLQIRCRRYGGDE